MSTHRTLPSSEVSIRTGERRFSSPPAGRPLANVDRVKLDVYRSCSFAEKRQVLGAFWRGQESESSKIMQGSAQYGPWALLMLIAIEIELLVLLVLLVGYGHPVGWLVLAPGALVAIGIWRAAVQTRRSVS